MGLLTRLDHFLVKFEEVLLALLLVSLIVLAATQVLLRNIWSTSIDWADMTLQNATVVIALLGAAVATSEGRHLNIDLVGRALKGRQRLALNVLIGIFGVIICALLTRGGWQTYRANYEPWIANLPAGWSAMRLLQQEIGEGSFPQWLSQLMLPAGFGLIGLHFFLRLTRDLSGLISGKSTAAGEEALEGDGYLDHIVASTEESAEIEQEEPEQEEPEQESRLAAELDDATISDALSDTLAPESAGPTRVEEDEDKTLLDPRLEDEIAEAPTELTHSRTDDGEDDSDEDDAATDLMLLRDDDEEPRR